MYKVFEDFENNVLGQIKINKGSPELMLQPLKFSFEVLEGVFEIPRSWMLGSGKVPPRTLLRKNSQHHPAWD